MDASGFISRKLRFHGRISAVSIAVSFVVIVLALGVTSGFRQELRKGIAQISGDVRLSYTGTGSAEGEPAFSFAAPFVDSIRALDYVSAVGPVVERPGIVKRGENIFGVLFKGVPEGYDSLGVKVPVDLARIAGLSVGDRLTAYFAGERVRVRNFTVRELYSGILGGRDNMVIYASIADMQALSGIGEDEATALEVRLRGNSVTPEDLNAASAEIGSIAYSAPDAGGRTLSSTSSSHQYPQIFSWLELIDINVLLVLGLMIAVAGFNMVSGLLIMLIRNISVIGTLKTLGMRDRSIAKIFLTVASRVVLKGMLAGNIIGVVLCLVQQHAKLIGLDPENYFISYVPVNLDFRAILLVDAVSFAAIMLILLLPALFIAGVDPAKTVRAQ